MVFELDHGCHERPADRQPECDRDEEDGARQHHPSEDEDGNRSEKWSEPAQRKPIRVPLANRAIRVDLDQRARRRGLAIRSGATGVQVARTAAKIRRPSSVPMTRRRGSGLMRSCVSAREPFATAEQKKSVDPVPKAPPVGIA